jgi:hypothetical protein
MDTNVFASVSLKGTLVGAHEFWTQEPIFLGMLTLVTVIGEYFSCL